MHNHVHTKVNEGGGGGGGMEMSFWTGFHINGLLFPTLLISNRSQYMLACFVIAIACILKELLLVYRTTILPQQLHWKKYSSSSSSFSSSSSPSPPPSSFSNFCENSPLISIDSKIEIKSNINKNANNTSDNHSNREIKRNQVGDKFNSWSSRFRPLAPPPPHHHHQHNDGTVDDDENDEDDGDDDDDMYMQLVYSSLYGVNLVLGYGIMLILMSMNVGLCVTIVISSIVGHALAMRIRMRCKRQQKKNSKNSKKKRYTYSQYDADGDAINTISRRQPNFFVSQSTETTHNEDHDEMNADISHTDALRAIAIGARLRAAGPGPGPGAAAAAALHEIQLLENESDARDCCEK